MGLSFHLVRHPHVFAKLRAEITSYPKDSDSITRTDLNKMTYLQNVLKEGKCLDFIECKRM